MQHKERIDQLISYQDDWVKQINKIMDEFIEIRDKNIPISNEHLSRIVSAQENIAGAIKNISDAIQAEINR